MSVFWVNTLHQAIIVGTPLALAGLGELVAETAGIINLGVEGTMLVGAVTAFGTSLATRDVWIGLICGGLAGALFGSLHALLTVSLRVNQVAVGLTLVLLGTGLSGYIGRSFAGRPLHHPLGGVSVPLLRRIPGIGPVFFEQDWIVYGTIVLVVTVWAVLHFSVVGLHLRSAGEDPGVADSAGVRVYQVRYLAVITGGALAGVAGGYFSVAFAHAWASQITGGQGWIAIALVIVSGWRPLRLLGFALIFGVVDSLNFSLQAHGVTIPSSLLQMMPYVFTLVVFGLSMVRRRGVGGLGPSWLGRPYDREARV